LIVDVPFGSAEVRAERLFILSLHFLFKEIKIENYYCDDQYKAQYLIGDATGASMIVEGDSIIMKNGDYQVATNFYHSEPVMVAMPHSFTLNGTICCSFIYGIILMGGIRRKKKKSYIFIVTILVIFLVFFSCKEEIKADADLFTW
jgi:hypothetical protein